MKGQANDSLSGDYAYNQFSVVVAQGMIATVATDRLLAAVLFLQHRRSKGLSSAYELKHLSDGLTELHKRGEI